MNKGVGYATTRTTAVGGEHAGLASGAPGTSSSVCTVTVVVAAVLSPKPSLTTSWNVSVVGPSSWPRRGAVNAGADVSAPMTVTAGPPVCTQW